VETTKVEAHPIVLGCMATTDEQDPCVASASRVASVYHLAGGLGNFPVVGLRWGGGETAKHHPDADTLELPTEDSDGTSDHGRQRRGQ